jgi:cysteine synthase A
MSRLHASILETIGRTPVVRINRLAPEGVNLYAKLEAFNPLGSVKDRMALSVIEEAERSGRLKPGQTVVEATSGNTGLGLAMVCAAKGYPLVIVMAENFSVERRLMLRFLGAKVVLTPATERGTGMLGKAVELAEAHGWFLCRQFENEANADAHVRTTAREILADFEGIPLHAWVSGFGTGGTLKGVGRVLKRERPQTRIVAAEPDNSPLLASGIPQQRKPDGSPAGSHPRFSTHLIQGWGADFVPKLAEDALREGLVDEVVGVNSGEAVRLARELATREGIFTGISGGATLAAALKVCEGAPEGARVLCMLPDTGERYLSTVLFADVPVEMTDEETEISRSTPHHRFDACATAGRSPATFPPATDEARAFVERALAEPDPAVTIFALEWCELCWAVRRLFEAARIPYRALTLDSVEYQAGDRGLAIRSALAERTGARTVPQVFVGGELVGGCDETLAAFRSRQLHERLAARGVEPAAVAADPASFLPGWLARR